MVEMISASDMQLKNAKIDSKENQAIMGIEYPSIYEHIIEKTQDLTMRSYQLATNVQRRRGGRKK